MNETKTTKIKNIKQLLVYVWVLIRSFAIGWFILMTTITCLIVLSANESVETWMLSALLLSAIVILIEVIRKR